MFLGLDVLDWVLLAALVGFVVSGWRKAFLVALGGLVGFLAGAAAAFFAVPLVSSWIPDPGWRVAGLIASFVALLALGHGAGEAVAAAIRGWLDRPRPRWWDRMGGVLVNLVGAGTAISALAFTFSTLGLPLLSAQIADSKVVTTARALTPEAVERALGEARSLVAGIPLPEILAPVQSPEATPTEQDADLSSPELTAAAASVVRITGTAAACGVNQIGTGFAVAPDRILTNAHVVEGVSDPVVETPDGRALTGDVVSFDPVNDVAVIAVPDLNLDTLQTGTELNAGASAVFMGYPAGGPFAAATASVQSRHEVNVPDIDGENPAPLEIYQLAADVQQGNSGGPLLDTRGRVVGMVFAKAKNTADVGYALTLDEISSSISSAPTLTKAVGTGTCRAH